MNAISPAIPRNAPLAQSVGILTFHNSYNVGASLQAFALQRTIQNLGHSCAMIDYARPLKNTMYEWFRVPKNKISIEYNLKLIRTFRSQVLLRNRFARFRSQHMRLTLRTYRSASELSKYCPAFDRYVSGSDQVWDPGMLCHDLGPIFYLDWICSGKRIAYAPSFGVDQMPELHRRRVADFIRRFDALSAREDSGCRIIRDLTGREAEHVLDPTFLLSAAEYDKVRVTPRSPEPCILLYPMQNSDTLTTLALNLREHHKLPLVAVIPINLNPWKFRFADKVVFDAGPAEFLGWMRNAAMVCTNSFHGLAFSLIYRKAFLSVPHSTRNTRSQSLLEQVGLLQRQLAAPRCFALDDPLLAPIDYAPVEMRLQQEMDRSLNYLRLALE